MFGSIFGFASDLLGRKDNRRSAKRSQEWTTENMDRAQKHTLSQMDYQSQLKRKDSTFMRDQLYEGKLSPWELAGQSGYSSGGFSGGAGAPSGASQAPSGGLQQMAQSAQQQILQEGQLENARDIAETQGLAQIYSSNAGDTAASQNAADAFKRDTGQHHFASAPQSTIPERQLELNNAIFELNEDIFQWEKTNKAPSWVKMILGQDTGQHHFASAPQSTIPERQLELNNAIFELNEDIFQWEKTNKAPSWVKMILGQDTVQHMSQNGVPRIVGDAIADSINQLADKIQPKNQQSFYEAIIDAFAKDKGLAADLKKKVDEIVRKQQSMIPGSSEDPTIK